MSLLLAPGFLYTNICLKKHYVQYFDDAFLKLEKTVYEVYSESIALYMYSKQLNVVVLTILSVNSVHKFSEIYLSYSLKFYCKNIPVILVNLSYFSNDFGCVSLWTNEFRCT